MYFCIDTFTSESRLTLYVMIFGKINKIHHKRKYTKDNIQLTLRYVNHFARQVFFFFLRTVLSLISEVVSAIRNFVGTTGEIVISRIP